MLLRRVFFFGLSSERFLFLMNLSYLLKTFFIAASKLQGLFNHFPYKVKLGLVGISRRFLGNQKATNARVEAENLQTNVIH